MLRQLAASWLFAGFLVVVAVVTWRVLDTRSVLEGDATPLATPLAAPLATAAAPVPPVVTVPIGPPAPPADPVLAASELAPRACGDDPFDAERADNEPPRHAHVQIGTQPFAETFIDGEPMGSTPFYGRRKLPVDVGEHELEFRDKTTGQRYRYELKVKGDDADNKVIVILGKESPRVQGKVSVRPLGKALTDKAAQSLFGDAVDALRDRRTREGCDILERIADRAPMTSRWKEKAEILYSRRCD